MVFNPTNSDDRNARVTLTRSAYLRAYISILVSTVLDVYQHQSIVNHRNLQVFIVRISFTFHSDSKTRERSRLTNQHDRMKWSPDNWGKNKRVVISLASNLLALHYLQQEAERERTWLCGQTLKQLNRRSGKLIIKLLSINFLQIAPNTLFYKKVV